MTDNFIESSWINKDKSFELSLRPENLSEFTGQPKILKQLEILLGAAKKRGEAVCHCLFSGPPGLGKTTLANIVSKSMKTNLITTSGPVLEKPGDLAGVLTNLQDGDILFIDEIHRLSKSVEEYLYPAMEDYKLDLLIDAGPNARSVQVKLNRFTLIGATTRSGLISSPMRSRFNFNARLDYYSPEDLKQIIVRSSKILNVELDEESSLVIAKRSRGTPRIANNLVKWVRDFAQMNQVRIIDKQTALSALALLSIDDLGLDDMDKKLLNVIIENYQGGPVGVQTLAVAIGEEPSTIAEVYEPYLIMQGLLKRTLRGREVTKFAYEHMGKKYPQN
jgi:holliday junction DNA helicase RuvB